MIPDKGLLGLLATLVSTKAIQAKTTTQRREGSTMMTKTNMPIMQAEATGTTKTNAERQKVRQQECYLISLVHS
jgi:hypothetical protein